jgi:hypothetical protein
MQATGRSTLSLSHKIGMHDDCTVIANHMRIESQTITVHIIRVRLLFQIKGRFRLLSNTCLLRRQQDSTSCHGAFASVSLVISSIQINQYILRVKRTDASVEMIEIDRASVCVEDGSSGTTHTFFPL